MIGKVNLFPVQLILIEFKFESITNMSLIKFIGVINFTLLFDIKPSELINYEIGNQVRI